MLILFIAFKGFTTNVYKKHCIQSLPINVSNSRVIKKKRLQKFVLLNYLIAVCLQVMSKAEFIKQIAKLLVSVQFRRMRKEFIFASLHVLHRVYLNLQ
jgi:hypothetical protein